MTIGRITRTALMLVAAVVTGMIGTVESARGQGFDVFTISGITIDREAETAAAARDLALADGRLDAYKRLLARLTLPEDVATLEPVTDAVVVPLVRDFTLDNEKTSSVRYIAGMKVRFEPEAVRAHFRMLGVSFSETVSKPLLVVPVTRFAGRLNLWNEPNPWRQAWAELEFQRGLVPLSTPVGDLSDIGTIDAAQAVQGQQDMLFALADNYGAEEAIVALAEPVFDQNAGITRVDVTLERHSRVLPSRTVVDSFQTEPGEDEFALYARAAAGLAARIEADWKRDTRLDFSASQEIYATVPLSGLKDLVSVRGRLTRAAPVRHADVLTLSREAAEMRLSYLGALDQLQLALAQSDLVLREELGLWVIRDAGNLPPLPQPVLDPAAETFTDQPDTVVITGDEPSAPIGVPQ